jgi:hypothetical protein
MQILKTLLDTPVRFQATILFINTLPIPLTMPRLINALDPTQIDHPLLALGRIATMPMAGLAVAGGTLWMVKRFSRQKSPSAAVYENFRIASQALVPAGLVIGLGIAGGMIAYRFRHPAPLIMAMFALYAQPLVQNSREYVRRGFLQAQLTAPQL